MAADGVGAAVVDVLDRRQQEIDSGDVTSLGHQYLPETVVLLEPGKVSVVGAQNLKVAETGGAVWEGSVVCAQYFALHAELLRGRPKILELGAGTGFCGAALAVLAKQQHGEEERVAGPHVCVTDDAANVELMASTLSKNAVDDVAVAEAYRWGQDVAESSHLKRLAPFDIICGTDLLYNPDSMDDLLRALVAMSGPDTTVFLCWKTRFAFVENHFLEKLAPQHFHVDCLFVAAPRCFEPGHAMKMYRLRRRQQATC